MSAFLEEFLAKYEGHQHSRKREGIERFLKFVGKDIETIVREYRGAEDKNEWAREYGNELVKFYKYLLSRGYAINTARTWTVPFRSFCREKPIPLIIPRKEEEGK